MSWVHPATLRPDSQALRCTAGARLSSSRTARKSTRLMRPTKPNRGSRYFQWRRSKNSPCRVLERPNYRFSRRAIVKFVHKTRFHLHERADAARRLMTHVRDHAASAAGRENGAQNPKEYIVRSVSA